MMFVRYLDLKGITTKYSLLLVVSFAVIRLSSQTNCDYNKQYRMIPINDNLKPQEEAAKELIVSDKKKCSTKCYYDDMCLAFVFSKNDGVCSIYHRSLQSMTYEKKMGTTTYGKKISVRM